MGTGHKTYSFFSGISNFNKVKFQDFSEIFNNFTRIVSPPSILNGFRFCLFCWIDNDTGHKTYSFFSEISNFNKVKFQDFNEIFNYF